MTPILSGVLPLLPGRILAGWLADRGWLHPITIARCHLLPHCYTLYKENFFDNIVCGKVAQKVMKKETLSEKTLKQGQPKLEEIYETVPFYLRV